MDNPAQQGRAGFFLNGVPMEGHCSIMRSASLTRRTKFRATPTPASSIRYAPASRYSSRASVSHQDFTHSPCEACPRFQQILGRPVPTQLRHDPSRPPSGRFRHPRQRRHLLRCRLDHDHDAQSNCVSAPSAPLVVVAALLLQSALAA